MAGKDGNGLISYVHLLDDSGQPQVFGPEDELPEWALDKIGDHCFEDGKKPSKSRAQKAHSDSK
jgi:hypothetical protein